MEKSELDKLMLRVAEGDNQAFGELYRATAKGVYAFAYSYLNNSSDAEDVMQSAFLQIKRKAYTYKKGSNARAWILQIVKNLALDELRKRKRRRQTNYPPDERDAVISPTEPSALDYMMKCLTDEEREVVILHVVWGYKHREIAEKLEIPVGTVTWRYNQAIKKLEKFKEGV